MIALASASESRSALLRQAGISFFSQAVALDEQAIRDAAADDQLNAAETAVILAEMKARRLSQTVPDLIVLGADQMLECHGQWFEKPKNRQEAQSQLQFLRGKQHQLISAVVAVRNGQILWHHTSTANMSMRMFSDEFLNEYLNKTENEILKCVGAYQLEGMGSQLFSKIEGDYFTILGLPLLAVLDFLRENGEVQQ